MLRGLKIFAIVALLCPPLTGVLTAFLVGAFEVTMSVNGLLLLAVHLLAGVLGWWIVRKLDRSQTR